MWIALGTNGNELTEADRVYIICIECQTCMIVQYLTAKNREFIALRHLLTVVIIASPRPKARLKTHQLITSPLHAPPTHPLEAETLGFEGRVKDGFRHARHVQLIRVLW